MFILKDIRQIGERGADLTLHRYLPPNRRKPIALQSPSGVGLLAARADIGPCRTTIGPTRSVRPILLHQFGEFFDSSFASPYSATAPLIAGSFFGIYNPAITAAAKRILLVIGFIV